MVKLYNKEKTLVFCINQHDYIIIESSNPLNEITCCDQSAVALIRNNKKYELDSGKCTDTKEHLFTIKNKCVMALNNQLTIDKTIQKNLGKLYAHHSFYITAKNKALDLGVVFNTKDYWDGDKYLSWSGNYALWIYNTPSTNTITLECTPTYHPQYYYNIKGRTRYVEYTAYLKNYGTLFMYELPKETVCTWLTLAEKYIKLCQDNIDIHFESKS
ncbi:hypothetical protein EKK58_06440 [Candidatus Dependentiae bacterium]|nr:MAG: hypothetical protein EKK58_06440 [Candidatus Dependentiae bacterium]